MIVSIIRVEQWWLPQNKSEWWWITMCVQVYIYICMIHAMFVLTIADSRLLLMTPVSYEWLWAMTNKYGCAMHGWIVTMKDEELRLKHWGRDTVFNPEFPELPAPQRTSKPIAQQRFALIGFRQKGENPYETSPELMIRIHLYDWSLKSSQPLMRPYIFNTYSRIRGTISN